MCISVCVTEMCVCDKDVCVRVCVLCLLVSVSVCYKKMEIWLKGERRCQFHQHFMYKFLVRMLFWQLFLRTCN